MIFCSTDRWRKGGFRLCKPLSLSTCQRSTRPVSGTWQSSTIAGTQASLKKYKVLLLARCREKNQILITSILRECCRFICTCAQVWRANTAKRRNDRNLLVNWTHSVILSRGGRQLTTWDSQTEAMDAKHLPPERIFTLKIDSVVNLYLLALLLLSSKNTCITFFHWAAWVYSVCHSLYKW